jgi:hypothetical protein
MLPLMDVDTRVVRIDNETITKNQFCERRKRCQSDGWILNN